MNVYIACAYPDIKIKDEFLELLNKDREIARRVKYGLLKFIDIGANLSYSKEYNEQYFGTLANAENMAKAIAETNDIGIIFCLSGVGAANYVAMYSNIIIAFPEDDKQAKQVRIENGANVFPLSSEYSYKYKIRTLKKLKSFILAELDPYNEYMVNSRNKLKSRFDRKR